LIRLNDLLRSKFKVDIFRHSSAAREELLTKIVFQRYAGERVLKQFGIRQITGTRARSVNQWLTDSRGDAAANTRQKACLSGSFKNGPAAWVALGLNTLEGDTLF